MLATLLHWDTAAFYALNHGPASALLDRLMPPVTYSGTFGLVWLVMAALLFFKGGTPGRRAALLTVAALLLGNLLSDDWLKNLIARPRPFTVLPDVRLLVKAPGDYSFPSGHATAAFAGAAVLARYFNRRSPLIWFYAVLIALSRVYVGVHYPGDILAGALIGYLAGQIVLVLSAFMRRRPAG